MTDDAIIQRPGPGVRLRIHLRSPGQRAVDEAAAVDRDRVDKQSLVDVREALAGISWTYVLRTREEQAALNTIIHMCQRLSDETGAIR